MHILNFLWDIFTLNPNIALLPKETWSPIPCLKTPKIRAKNDTQSANPQFRVSSHVSSTVPWDLEIGIWDFYSPTCESQWRFSLIACILDVQRMQSKFHPSFHLRPTRESLSMIPSTYCERTFYELRNTNYAFRFWDFPSPFHECSVNESLRMTHYHDPERNTREDEFTIWKLGFWIIHSSFVIFNSSLSSSF